jgi:SAM-dependent methyltransferase
MIRRIASRLYRSSPHDLLRSLRDKLRRRRTADGQVDAIAATLREKFAFYQAPNLKNIAAGDFREQIQARIGAIDARSEGYADGELERQRDLSIKFCWGHTHDFGDFKLEGRMRDRHIALLANFVQLFPVSLGDFASKDVLDVGCWTGGTTLLLAALGARVHAIEEVRKYAETTAFLARCFGVDDRVHVDAASLYACDAPAYYERFDVAYFPGVLYHLSDPLVGLRILFNSLKDGGIILVESEGINHLMPFCQFEGSQIHLCGSKEELNRGGWNWFLPSPAALARMLREAGFEQVEALWHAETGRVYGYGRRLAHTGICRAGLSVPNIR